MPDIPSTDPYPWATGAGRRIAPISGEQGAGYLEGEPVPPLTSNALIGVLADWVRWLTSSFFGKVTRDSVRLPVATLNWTTINKAGGAFEPGAVGVTYFSDVSGAGETNSYVAASTTSTGRYATTSTVLTIGGDVTTVTAHDVKAGVTGDGGSVTVRVNGFDIAGSAISDTWSKAFTLTTGVVTDHVLTRSGAAGVIFYGPLTVEVLLRTPGGSGDLISTSGITLDFT